MEFLSANLTVMIQAAQKSGRMMLRDFGELENLAGGSGREKFAAASFERVENTLCDMLLDARPKFGIAVPNGEQKGEDISHRFVVKAISGFENYTRGLPLFAISIALQEQGKSTAAVIYNPILDKLYYAEKGAGAFALEGRGGRRLRVSKYADKPFTQNIGSDALEMAWVASSNLDYAKLSGDVFDAAAGDLLVREAGGRITERDGSVIAENGLS